VSTGSTIEFLLKRDRVVVISGVALVVIAAAAYIVAGVGMNASALTMTRMAVEMPEMTMQQASWSADYALLVFLMWWVMMVAMMLPSAAPVVLIHAAIGRKQRLADKPLAATTWFAAGYLSVWAGFSLIATALQWGLESLSVVGGMMDIASPSIAGVVLLAAGLYQLTPLKAACLRHCQHPLSFVIHKWRAGNLGAFRMGLEHGGYCLGCCWFLMALLFVGGIMNLIWIGAIAIYVGLEKFAAGHRWLTVTSGALLMTAGLYLLGNQVA